jgi:AraC-like DNA-binding protein
MPLLTEAIRPSAREAARALSITRATGLLTDGTRAPLQGWPPGSTDLLLTLSNGNAQAARPTATPSSPPNRDASARRTALPSTSAGSSGGATGTTLTEYWNRVRVLAAIERLAGGEDRLADLAAQLGFVDQSHLARLLRQAVGLPPGRLRHHLAS